MVSFHEIVVNYKFKYTPLKRKLISMRAFQWAWWAVGELVYYDGFVKRCPDHTPYFKTIHALFPLFTYLRKFKLQDGYTLEQTTHFENSSSFSSLLIVEFQLNNTTYFLERPNYDFFLLFIVILRRPSTILSLPRKANYSSQDFRIHPQAKSQ